MDQMDFIAKALANQNFADGGIAIGTSSKTAVKLANTVTFTSEGIQKAKTTAEYAFTATTHDITANASSVQERVYVLCLDASGNGVFVAGDQATGAGNAKFPDAEDIYAAGTPVGAVRLAIAAGATDFDATTDELDEAHITDTYYDILGPILNRFASAWI